jgi:hypothetical protein
VIEIRLRLWHIGYAGALALIATWALVKWTSRIGL